MADLGELLGSILVGIAHARRVADEETAAIAELYRDEPLLEGMAVPRIRLPEVVIEAPIVVESYEQGDTSTFESPKKIRRGLVEVLSKAAGEVEAELPQTFVERFDANLSRGLDRLMGDAPDPARRPSAESVVRVAEAAYSQTIRQVGDDYRRRIDADQNEFLRGELRTYARRVALKRVGKPPRLDVTLATGVVKERADAANVARLRLVIKEEGLEWSVSKEQDGSVRGTLTPE